MTPDRVPSKYCRYCGRIIPMDTVNCPYCERNVIRMPGQKACPFCGEPIRAEAIKCRHCGEFVEERPGKEPEAEQPPQQGQVIYIDKAVIARSDETGELRIEGAGPGVRLEPGSEEARRLLGKGADEPREAAGTLPAGRKRPALPPGEQAGVPAVPEKAPPPARRPEPALPAKARKPKKPKKEKKPKEGKKAPAGEPPEARYECPSCGRFVYEGDHYCENCGRDLSIPAGRREFPGPSRAYRPADYALMVGAAAPVGLLVSPGAALGVAAVGGALGAWSLVRTAGSQGERTGMGHAVGAIVAAVFWIAVIALFGW